MKLDFKSITASNMEATSTLTVSEIIGRAGGPRAIADASQQSREPFSKDAVYKWAKGGIPDRHWPIIIALTGLKVAQIYEANVAARGVTFPMPVLEAAE
ncbi:carph-isopro domain-containing protein [Agrobacterium rosae]